MLAIFGLTFYLIVPQIASEIGNITAAFPADSKVNTVVNALSDFANARKALGSQELINTEIFNQTVQNIIKIFSSGVISGVSGFFQGVVNLILVLVISIYIKTKKKGVENFLRTVTPRKYESRVIKLWNRTNYKIGQWLKSQLLSSAILTILTYVGLTIINMPYTIVLSLIAGITSLVPFGIFIGTLPAIIVALTTGGFGMALNVVILYVLLQQIQDYGFQPYIVGKATGVPTVGVLISFVASVTLFGIWGVFLGLPAAILISELFQDLDKTREPETISRT